MSRATFVVSVAVCVLVAVALMGSPAQASSQLLRGHAPWPSNPFDDRQPATDTDIVDAPAGRIRGLVYETHRAFLGIPYALPPIGSRRWRPPTAQVPFGYVFNATQFAPGCPQNCQLPPHTCPPKTTEDCLTLNVYTPLSSGDSPSPVMVFIPGGRFEQGTAGVSLYDGRFLTNYTDVILVTINYRLGALGWAYSEEVLGGGNFGLLDQQMALTWVQENIKAFGGDASRVTLFGQSAGGTSTSSHLCAPGSEHLFHQAIIESNPIGLPCKDKADAEWTAKKFFKDLGCESGGRSCLESKSVEEVLAAQVKSQNKIPFHDPLELFLPWTPTVDDKVLSADPLDAFRNNTRQPKPIMIGTVRDEALMFIWDAFAKPLSRIELDAVLAVMFPFHALPSITKLYPEQNHTDSRWDMAPVGTDYLFFAPMKYALANGQPSPVYSYFFDHVMSFGKGPNGAWGPEYYECYNYVCHAEELPFVFNTAQTMYNVTAEEETLSKTIQQYWGNFAHSGNPNLGPHTAPAKWNLYNPSADNQMMFKTPSVGEVTKLRNVFTDMWINEVGWKIPRNINTAE